MVKAQRKPASGTTSELSAEARQRFVYDSGTEISRQWPAVAAKVTDADLATYASSKAGDSVARCLRRGFIKTDSGLVVPELRVITAPKGGKIFELPPIRVDEGCDLRELIIGTMRDSDFANDLFKGEVLQKFPPCPGLVRTVRLVLANFGDIANAEPADIWGRSQGLPHATVRTVFTIAREHPELHTEMGLTWLWLVSLEQVLLGGDPRIASAKWFDTKRVARLYWFLKGWSAFSWFAFIRECA